jgi:hypothetical protein
VRAVLCLSPSIGGSSAGDDIFAGVAKHHHYLTYHFRRLTKEMTAEVRTNLLTVEVDVVVHTTSSSAGILDWKVALV